MEAKPAKPDDLLDGGGEAAPENLLVIRLCKCGRAPRRKNQRNCHFCNREADAKYRKELKRVERRLALVSQKLSS